MVTAGCRVAPRRTYKAGKGRPLEYFFYCRDNPGMAPLRAELTEAHWSFMDGYAARMIARGPTFADDGVTPTGSMHIVDLPDLAAARVFGFQEPNYKAGVYGEVMMRRWRNMLGRTMWAFAGDPQNGHRFLVIGHGRLKLSAAGDGFLQGYSEFIAEAAFRDRLIVCGPLLSDDGSAWVGNALTIESPSPSAVEAMLATDPFARAGLYERIEIHRWRFGGRR